MSSRQESHRFGVQDLSELNKKLADKFKDMSSLNFNSIRNLSVKLSRNGAGSLGSEHSAKNAPRHSDGSADTYPLDVVDSSALADSFALEEESKAFLRSASETLMLSRQSQGSEENSSGLTQRQLLRLSQSLTKWRVKGQGSKLYNQHEALVTRTNQVELALKDLTDKSMNQCASLLLQASHLRARLTACSKFNQTQIELIKPKVDFAKDLLKQLQSTKEDVENMIVFFDDVEHIKKCESQSYIPWAMRAVAAEQAAKGAIHPSHMKRSCLEKRLETVKMATDALQQVLNRHAAIYDHRLTAFKKCSETLLSMESLLLKLHAARTIAHEAISLTGTISRENPINARKQQLNTDSEPLEREGEKAADALSQSNSAMDREDTDDSIMLDEDSLPPVDAYDHAHCDDCLFVQTLGKDCCMNIAAVQHFAEESTMRLQKLFSMREHIREKAVKLEAIDWGEA